MNLTTATPLEIDTALAAAYGDLDKAERNLATVLYSVHLAAGDQRDRRRNWSLDDEEALALLVDRTEIDKNYLGAKAGELLDRWHKAVEAVRVIEDRIEPLEDEYNRRPWNRAFLVQNNNGHVHKTRNCSTCFASTQFYWVVEFAGKDEAEIVEAAGERACTVCYPSAPVDVLNRPSRIFGPDEIAAQQERAERAAAKDKRQADKIAKALTADGSEFRLEFTRWDKPEHEYFKTARTAELWYVEKWADHKLYGYSLPNAEAFATLVELLAAKQGKTEAQVRAALDAKVAAKIKRDRG